MAAPGDRDRTPRPRRSSGAPRRAEDSTGRPPRPRSSEGGGSTGRPYRPRAAEGDAAGRPSRPRAAEGGSSARPYRPRGVDERTGAPRPRRDASDGTPRAAARNPSRATDPDARRSPGRPARTTGGPRRADADATPRRPYRRDEPDGAPRPAARRPYRRDADDDGTSSRPPARRPYRRDDADDGTSSRPRPYRSNADSDGRSSRPRPPAARSPYRGSAANPDARRSPGRPASRATGGAPRRPRDETDGTPRPAARNPSRATDSDPSRAPRNTGANPRARQDREAGGGLFPEARKAVARGRTPEPPMPKKWGGVARRGARVVGEPREGSASDVWRESVDRDRAAPAEWEPEVWIEDPADPDDPASSAAAQPDPAGTRRSSRSTPASARAASQPRRPRRREPRLPDPVKDELGKANRKLAPRLEQRLADAVRAYEADRYQDARRMLRPLVETAPDAAAVRELLGLTLYRMNRWHESLKELEAFHALSGSYDQHPVRMDANRALRRWAKVDELWTDLKEASPGADVVAEGRIVAAGALADRGRLAEAVRLLERAPAAEVKKPKLHHLRTWYALADLYERAGEIPRARALFTAVLRHDADFADVPERLATLA